MDIYAMSNRFHKADFYYNKTTFRFPVPTSDNPEIIKGALVAFAEIYQEDLHFKKQGIHMRELTQEKPEQQLLFDTVDRGQYSALMKAMDAVNANMGRRTVSYASSGLSTDLSKPKIWRTQFNHKSPSHYLMGPASSSDLSPSIWPVLHFQCLHAGSFLSFLAIMSIKE